MRKFSIRLFNLIIKTEGFDYLYINRSLMILICGCGVVVITFASHAKGPQFKPGQSQFFFSFL